jgi:hypothetical protein
MTSLNWLFEKLWDLPKDKFTWYCVLEESKEMHKKEIINAYKADSFHVALEDAEQYYQETFNKD